MRFGLWRQKARLLESVRVLAEGGSVTDAALESGYSSVSAYIAAFKQTFGCTPGAMLTDQAVPAGARRIGRRRPVERRDVSARPTRV